MKPFITTRSIHFRETTEEAHRDRIQRTLVGGGHLAIADWTPKKGVTVEARVNHGNWIADCPVPHCRGAEFADPDWLFMVCAACGSGPFRVKFPASREAIEAALIERPALETRNWIPGETPKDLAAENEEHAEEIALGMGRVNSGRIG